MRAVFGVLLLAAVAVLSGCATTPPMVRSDVTSFHQWPQNVTDKSFSFAPRATAASLEVQSYEQLIGDQLARYGFLRKPSGGAFVVHFDADIKPREVKVSEPVDTWPYRDPFWPYRGWGGWGPYPYGWGPVYERSYTIQVFTRTLRVNIEQAGKRVFEATAVSEGTTKELPTILPYLAASVFEGFPGESGKTRRVELPLQK